MTAEQRKESLAFLYERGRDPARSFSGDEAQRLAHVHTAFHNASSVVLRLGGRAGRLGECIVATALLEGCLQALAYAGKAGMPVTIIVDDVVGELFHEREYHDAYWPGIHIILAPTAACLQPEDWSRWALPGAPTLLLDLHGAHDGEPYLQAQGGDTALLHLYRAGIRYYARHGPLRRYSDFVADLLGLPRDFVSPRLAQPAIRLGPEDVAAYATLAEAAGWDDGSLHIVGFFHSVVAAKCYERWDEVLGELTGRVGRRWPGTRIQVLIAGGPAEEALPGLPAEQPAAVSARLRNARIRVERIPSLRDLAILVARAALVLSNDTGPGHLAGALAVPTITVFLPGGVYSKEVWASSLWHRGITMEPSPFTTRQLEQAVVMGDTSIINSIDPHRLADAGFLALAGRVAPQ